MSVEDEDAALGYLRTFASSGGGLDLERRCGLGMGSEQFGAVAPRASTRMRKAPESLQMPPTMKGGDRAWQERIPAEVEVDHECSARMARGSTGRRGLVTKRAAKKELESGDGAEVTSPAQGERSCAVAKPKANEVRVVEGPLRDSQARSSRVRVSVSEDDGADTRVLGTRQDSKVEVRRRRRAARVARRPWFVSRCDRQLRSRNAKRGLRLLL